MDMEACEKQIDEVMNDGLNGLSEMEVGEQEYKNTVEGMAKLIEAKAKLYTAVSEAELNKQKAKDERTRGWVDTAVNIITSIGKMLIPVGIAFLSFGLEKEGVMSYSAGKNAIRDCWDNLKK